MADTGRCAVLDVSEVPKERPTGHDDNNGDGDNNGHNDNHGDGDCDGEN